MIYLIFSTTHPLQKNFRQHSFKSLPFDDRCAEEYGQIKAALAFQGELIGPNDLMIAAIARAYDAVLITNNTREFARVTGLRLQDWQK